MSSQSQSEESDPSVAIGAGNSWTEGVGFPNFICSYFLDPSYRERMLMFEELSDIFSDHNNHLTSRELLMKVRHGYRGHS